jgi:hypothetical protein
MSGESSYPLRIRSELRRQAYEMLGQILEYDIEKRDVDTTIKSSRGRGNKLVSLTAQEARILPHGK